jgi:rhodanese-related sulfurtransferase
MERQQSRIRTSSEVIEQITVDRLDAILSEGKFRIIDVRNPKGIETQGSVPGAVNIPLDTIDTVISDHLEGGETVFRGGGPFLFVCTGGVMSYMAAIRAQESGIGNIFNLEGGHSAWKQLKAADGAGQPA